MALSPMMQQYLEIKEDHKDEILFFRLGDFYEMFFEDAITASRELELTLTGRDCGLEERAPMCGVPYHACDTYLSLLIEKGYKVAICEQLEDPALAKGIVKRGVIRVVTPGTIFPEQEKSKENWYIVCIARKDNHFGLAVADITTGDFSVFELSSIEELRQQVFQLHPKEAVFPYSEKKLLEPIFSSDKNIYLSPEADFRFDEKQATEVLTNHFSVHNIIALSLSKENGKTLAAGALLSYLKETQKNALTHITTLSVKSDTANMRIDPFTYRNLELTETLREGKRKGSLISILDKTKTAMGSRLMRKYIDSPLQDRVQINRRLEAVEEIFKSLRLRLEIQQAVSGIYDIERLVSRISYSSFDARTAVSLKQSIHKLPLLKKALTGTSSYLLKNYSENLDSLEDLFEYLDSSLNNDPPIGVKDGGLIKAGFNEEVDQLRTAQTDGKNWIIALEKREREATGIKNLRVGFNKVFGYYIEVTRSYLDQVPYTYTRKQTLAGAERFITEELKDMENLILNAEERLKKLEYRLFVEIREKLLTYTERLQETAKLVAKTDVLCALAQAAYDNGYVRPTISEDGIIDIKNGRHPVVEKTVGQEFVPNDVYLNEADNRLIIITGPNMAGKSTFMRQIGLIVIMAHIGSFVPASSAKICITDRIFTRVGASDDLASGQSTFMVEMNELAGILANATEHSLLILDEIGRGTSTLDGLSIAWATVEYIASKNTIGAKTLFATHYHELIDLEETLEGVKNYSVSVKEYNQSIIFLHKIKRGGTDKSFGVEVARLAGLPEALLTRAKHLLTALEKTTEIDLTRVTENAETQAIRSEALPSPNLQSIEKALKEVNINALTPLEALSLLNDLKQKVE